MSNTNKPRHTPQETQAIVARGLKRRYWAERRFRSYGFVAIVAALTFLVYLFFVIFSNGLGAFRQAEVQTRHLLRSRGHRPGGNPQCG